MLNKNQRLFNTLIENNLIVCTNNGCILIANKEELEKYNINIEDVNNINIY